MKVLTVPIQIPVMAEPYPSSRQITNEDLSQSNSNKNVSN